MARDYAKNSRKGTKSRARPSAQRKQKQQPTGGGVKLYFGGVLTGVFLSFLVYLATLPASDAPAVEDAGEAKTAQPQPKPRFDFYTMLPEQTIEVEVDKTQREPARDLESANPASERYILQAGSFRQREDADRRRAQLLLLGLEPNIQESSGETGRWHRVYLGPFASRSAMNKARSLTAEQDIDTLLLKRSVP